MTRPCHRSVPQDTERGWEVVQHAQQRTTSRTAACWIVLLTALILLSQCRLRGPQQPPRALVPRAAAPSRRTRRSREVGVDDLHIIAHSSAGRTPVRLSRDVQVANKPQKRPLCATRGQRVSKRPHMIRRPGFGREGRREGVLLTHPSPSCQPRPPWRLLQPVQRGAGGHGARERSFFAQN